MTDFDADTAVKALGGGRYAARVVPGWRAGAGPHGGYLAAILMHALVAELDDASRAPRSLTVHYPKPPADGPAEVAVRVERAGRSLATLSARMTQGDDIVGLALAAFSPPWEAPAWTEDSLPPPSPAPDDVPGLDHIPGTMPDFFANVEARPTLGAGFAGGGSDSVVGGWMRVRPPRLLDAPTVAFLCDAWWPAVFSRLQAPAGVPTIDLTIHFRRTLPGPDASAEDFVLGAFRTRTVAEGFLEEDGELWSPSGVLLAQSRQLALLRVPRA